LDHTQEVRGSSPLAPTILDSLFVCGDGPVGLDVDPSGRFLYVACRQSATVEAFSIHPTTGALAPVGSVPSGTSPAWIRILGSFD
jgi:6-phosphogluconolactonase (cycloisomerase 2 family)